MTYSRLFNYSSYSEDGNEDTEEVLKYAYFIGDIGFIAFINFMKPVKPKMKFDKLKDMTLKIDQIKHDYMNCLFNSDIKSAKNAVKKLKVFDTQEDIDNCVLNDYDNMYGD